MLYHNDMPNLQMLVAFEASARLLSFTAAAKELGTTQSAISQQMKGLEQWLETPLFERVYRGVRLTQEGQMLLDTAQSSLRQLQTVLNKIKNAKKNRQLRFFSDFAFAAYWLMPTLAAFRHQHPDIDIRLETSQSPSDVLSKDTDIAVLFGDGRYPGNQTIKLFSEKVYPVCSPHLLQQVSSLDPLPQLNQLPLLKLKAEAGSKWMSWDDMLRQYSGRLSPPESVMEFDNYTLLIQAAIAGQGIGLGWDPLLNSMINSGVLVPFTDFSLESQHGYYMVMAEHDPPPEVVLFARWLEDYLSDSL